MSELYVRVSQGVPSEPMLKVTSSRPSVRRMTSRIAPTDTWWPLGYSGWAGVLLHTRQQAAQAVKGQPQVPGIVAAGWTGPQQPGTVQDRHWLQSCQNKSGWCALRTAEQHQHN